MEKNPKDLQLDFIGVGTPKCGTEWLVSCLREHPDVDFSKHKESNFFITPLGGLNRYTHEVMKVKSWSEYANEFSWEEGKKKGEFSIKYIFDKKALKKVKDHFPNVKVILALRNPVDFLYSIYWYNKFSRAYHEVPDTFEEAIKVADKDDPYSLERAKFYKHTKNCIDIFGKENVHIILLDDIKKRPKTVLREMFKFIGINSKFIPENALIHVNKTQKVKYPALMKVADFGFHFLRKLGAQRLYNTISNTSNPIRVIYKKFLFTNSSYPPMNTQTRKELIKKLKKEITGLEKLLERDLSDWKKV